MDGNVTEFINKYPDSEIQELVTLREDNSSFSWEDADNNDISMRMWGDAIEKGILVESASGYRIKNTDEILEGLEDKSDEEQESINISRESKWRVRDKIVGVLVLFLVASFGVGILRDTVYEITNIPLRYLLDFLPFYVVIIILSSFTSILSVFVRNRIDSNSEYYRSQIREIRQEVSEEDKSMIDTSKKISQKQSEYLMNLQLNLAKDKVRPLIWTSAITIPFIIWIIVTSNTGTNISTVTYPLFGEHFWSGEVLGPIRTWIPLYAVCSLLFSQLVEKLF